MDMAHSLERPATFLFQTLKASFLFDIFKIKFEGGSEHQNKTWKLQN